MKSVGLSGTLFLSSYLDSTRRASIGLKRWKNRSIRTPDTAARIAFALPKTLIEHEEPRNNYESIRY